MDWKGIVVIAGLCFFVFVKAWYTAGQSGAAAGQQLADKINLSPSSSPSPSAPASSPRMTLVSTPRATPTPVPTFAEPLYLVKITVSSVVDIKPISERYTLWPDRHLRTQLQLTDGTGNYGEGTRFKFAQTPFHTCADLVKYALEKNLAVPPYTRRERGQLVATSSCH